MLAQQAGDSERGPFDHGRRKTACVASTISSVMLMNLVVVVLRAFPILLRNSAFQLATSKTYIMPSTNIAAAIDTARALFAPIFFMN